MTFLPIPDIRQEDDYDCGTACLDAVCAYWGKRKRGPAKLANPIQGMGPDTVESVLRSLGFQVIRGDMVVPLLKDLTKSGIPVMCPIQRDGCGHWVVVRGVGYGKVYYHCPIAGPSSAKVATWDEDWLDSTDAGHPYQRWGVAAHLL